MATCRNFPRLPRSPELKRAPTMKSGRSAETILGGHAEMLRQTVMRHDEGCRPQRAGPGGATVQVLPDASGCRRAIRPGKVAQERYSSCRTHATLEGALEDAAIPPHRGEARLTRPALKSPRRLIDRPAGTAFPSSSPSTQVLQPFRVADLESRWKAVGRPPCPRWVGRDSAWRRLGWGEDDGRGGRRDPDDGPWTRSSTSWRTRRTSPSTAHRCGSRRTTEGPIGVGTAFHAEMTGRKRVVPMTIRVTEFERPRRIRERVEVRSMDLTGGLDFEPYRRQHEDAVALGSPANGVLRFMGPLVASMGRRRSGGSGRDSSGSLRSRTGPQLTSER